MNKILVKVIGLDGVVIREFGMIMPSYTSYIGAQATLAVFTYNGYAHWQFSWVATSVATGEEVARGDVDLVEDVRVERWRDSILG